MTTRSSRFWTGAAYGLIATVVMSFVMALLYLVGASVMPEPIPLAQLARIVAATFKQHEISAPIVIAAIPIHLAYGAFWAGFLTASTRRVTWWKGLLLGMGLWAIMMVFFLPMSGPATFHIATSGRVWVVTLLLHAIYGVTFGALVSRHEPRMVHANE